MPEIAGLKLMCFDGEDKTVRTETTGTNLDIWDIAIDSSKQAKREILTLFIYNDNPI